MGSYAPTCRELLPLLCSSLINDKLYCLYTVRTFCIYILLLESGDCIKKKSSRVAVHSKDDMIIEL